MKELLWDPMRAQRSGSHGEKEQSRSTAEERPALTEPAFLSRAQGTATLCDYPDLKCAGANDDIVDADAEGGGQDHHVVQGRHRLSPLPLVDGLGIAEAKDVLEIAHRHSGLLPQADNVPSGCGHVNDRHGIHFELDLLFRL